MTSSVSRKRPVIHADASVSLQGAPRALCHVFDKGRLDYPNHLTAPRTHNPHNVTCRACNTVLKERGQLFCIMLAHTLQLNHKRCETKAVAIDGPVPYELQCIHDQGHSDECRDVHGFRMLKP